MKKPQNPLSNIRIIYILTTIFLVILTLYTFIQIKSLIESSDLVNHANHLKLSLRKISLTIYNAESNQQGYLLSEDSTFLINRDHALTSLSNELVLLDSLIIDNPTQIEQAKLLHSAIQEKLFSLERMMLENTPIQMTAGFAKSNVDGIKKMDRINLFIDQMNESEKQLLDHRTQTYSKQAHTTPLFIIIIFLGALLILLASYTRVNQALIHSKKLQAQLIQEKNMAESILNASEDLICVYDTETKIIYYGKTCEKLFGKTKEEVIGTKLLDSFPMMKDSKSYNDLMKAIKGEYIYNPNFYSVVWNRYFENFLIPLKTLDDTVYAVLTIAHDNTENVLASEKLIHTNQALAEAQRIAKVGSWEWDVQQNILSWSSSMYQIYGLPDDSEITFDKFSDLIHPDDRDFVIKSIQSAMENKQMDDFIHQIITPTGIVKTMHARGKVNINEAGDIVKMLGTGQDITEAKNVERKLAERTQFVESMINSSPDIITVIDKDLQLIAINDKSQNIISTLYKGNAIGKKIIEIFPDLIHTSTYQNLIRALEEEIVINSRAKSILSDTYYEHDYIPLKNSYNKVYAVMLISHDITRQLQNEQKIQQLNETFNYAEQIGLFGSYSYNLKKNTISYSDNLYRLLGCEPQEFLASSDNFNQFIHPDDLDYVIKASSQALSSNQFSKWDYRMIQKQGTLIYVRGTGKLISNTENEQWLIGTLQDVTEEKKSQESLEQKNNALDKMNKELQSFAYISSHDLQEPLRKIQTFASRLLEKEYQNLSDHGKDQFKRMQDAGQRMQTLIDDLLAYSRTNTESRKFELTPLKKIINEVIEDFKEELLQTQAIIETNELVEVNIIPFQFRQLIQNLFSNSIKFKNPEHPLIIKITSEIVKGFEVKHTPLSPYINYCHIKISDNGIGFEPQYSEKIFEVFQRLHAKEKYIGTGIGLAIVKKIVENHSGFIMAESQLNKGVVFNIYIPAN